MSKSKKPQSASKTERTNTGNRGARKNPQDVQALVRMGKGLAQSMKPLKG